MYTLHKSMTLIKTKEKESMNKVRIGIIGVLIVAALLMSLNLIVSAVEDKKEEEKKEQIATQSEMQLYKEQVAALEKKLDELKEEQYVNNREYEDKIAELELKLVAASKPSTPNEEKPKSDAKYTYTVSGDRVTITGYSGTDATLVIPDTIDGLSVVGIGREAFKGASFGEVILPSSLERIDWFAFSECTALKKVSIPASVNKIEYGVFDGADGFVIFCTKNSYAHRYAKSYGFATKFS